MAGIEIDEEKPGYKHILIKPQPGAGIEYAEADLASMYGRIKSAWRLEDGQIVVEVIVPPNTTASLTLPGVSIKQFSVGGAGFDGIDAGPGMTASRERVTVELGSGNYTFRYWMRIDG